ncbi:MAG: efflux RND transporter periplasmic adaptor subunit [Bacteroidales bacterium]
MKKRNRLIITILLILVAAVIVFYPKIKPLFSSKSGGPGGTGMTAGGGPGGSGRQVLNVSGYLIQPQQLSDLYVSTGTLKPDETVELAFETSGKIVGINFTEGTRVSKGDLLAKINDRPLQAQLEKLQAQKKLVEEKEFRQRSLLVKDAISQESYDQIVTELQTIQADINLVGARIAETELRAPFDGIIGLRYVSEGSYTNPSTKIARLVKIKPIKIEFTVPERYANQIKIGYPVTFTMDGSNEIYKATVYAVDPQVDIATRSIVLRALYPNNNEELKPGRFTSVTLLLSQIDDAISVPTEAITPEMEGEMVYVYRNGKAEVVKVGVGLRTESQVQITSGLKFGDTLLTSGILQLRQNVPVVLDTLLIN